MGSYITDCLSKTTLAHAALRINRSLVTIVETNCESNVPLSTPESWWEKAGWSQPTVRPWSVYVGTVVVFTNGLAVEG